MLRATVVKDTEYSQVRTFLSAITRGGEVPISENLQNIEMSWSGKSETC